MKGEYQLGSVVELQEEHKIVKTSIFFYFCPFVHMNIFQSDCSAIFLQTINKKKNKLRYKTPNLVGSKTGTFMSESPLRQIGVQSHRFKKRFCVHHQEINFVIIIKMFFNPEIQGQLEICNITR